jgi:predicted ATPase
MIYLNSIVFKKDYRNLKKGFRIGFLDITVLVGDQGTGKSSVLSLLEEYDQETLKFNLTEEAKTKSVKTFYFNTETMNPRTARMDDYSNPDGSSKGIGLGGFIASKFQSHGEVLQQMTVDMMAKAKDCVLFVDEPESGLSVRNQYQLIKNIRKALKNNTQLIIATHCIPLIQSTESVFDMETGKWISSIDYLKNFDKTK